MMDWLLTAIIATGALAIGGLLVWIARGRDIQAALTRLAAAEVEMAAFKDRAAAADTARTEAAALAAELAGARATLEGLARTEAELKELRLAHGALAQDKAALEANYAASEKARSEQIDQLTALRSDLQDRFQLLAGDVLKASNKEFLEQAGALFAAQKQLTAKEIDDRTAKIAELVKPLGESLKAYDEALKLMQTESSVRFGEISNALADVRAKNDDVKTVTASLVNALRASPKTRGRWGEETLRRVMELAGMVDHCDFATEKHFRGEDESLRPDVVISVAGGRVIVVDAKAPISAYIDALSATSDEERETLLKRHAAQMRERLNNLSSKSYWERIEGSPDCVVMFVPGDNFVSAAFERDPSLFEDGIKARVLICTPTTFIALAKAISYGWRQQRLAQNAADVARLGKDLYTRLSAMGDHVASMGKGLTNAVKSYNAFVGSLETSVLPQARKFQELGVEGTAKPLPETPQAEVVVRFPQPNRDLVITESTKGELL
jgi:DNA recombination protein RmuC